jgi:hypothetical protein
MDELDHFREFRSGVATPSADAERRASARLGRAIEGGDGRWSGVLRQVKKRRGPTALAFTALVGVAFAALLVGVPWRSSPGFLDRAQAGLAPPAGSILHVRWNETHVSRDLGCRVELPTQELWIDQTPPHRYRVLAWNLPDVPQGAGAGARACRHEGEIVELGRALDTGETTLMFVPPNTLAAASGVFLTYAPDPVTTLRDAITSGSAHHEGKAEIDGRTVERIRIECPERPCWGPRDYAYVDPETFSLVREEWSSGFTFTPGPGPETFRFDVALDYLTFEYLPRTAANVALTDIRAQHPDADRP